MVDDRRLLAAEGVVAEHLAQHRQRVGRAATPGTREQGVGVPWPRFIQDRSRRGEGRSPHRPAGGDAAGAMLARPRACPDMPPVLVSGRPPDGRTADGARLRTDDPNAQRFERPERTCHAPLCPTPRRHRLSARARRRARARAGRRAAARRRPGRCRRRRRPHRRHRQRRADLRIRGRPRHHPAASAGSPDAARSADSGSRQPARRGQADRRTRLRGGPRRGRRGPGAGRGGRGVDRPGGLARPRGSRTGSPRRRSTRPIRTSRPRTRRRNRSRPATSWSRRRRRRRP